MEQASAIEGFLELRIALGDLLELGIGLGELPGVRAGRFTGTGDRPRRRTPDSGDISPRAICAGAGHVTAIADHQPSRR